MTRSSQSDRDTARAAVFGVAPAGEPSVGMPMQINANAAQSNATRRLPDEQDSLS